MGLGQEYNEKLERLDNATNRFTALLSTNKEKNVRLFFNIVLTFIILCIYGCFDFVNLTFEITRIGTIEYWTTIITKVVSAVCSFNIGINFNWDLAIRSAVELREAIEKYEVLIKQKDDKTFDTFVNEIFNKKAKKRAWLNKINKKIYKLNKFTRYKDQALYTKVIPTNIPNFEKLNEELEQKRAANKYCIRRNELEYLKTNEYIDANIDSLNVKYSKVDASAFNLEINGKTKGENNKVTGNVGLAKVGASANIMLSMVVISMFTTALALSLNQQEFVDQMHAFWYYLVTCVMDAGLIIWNVFRGTRTAPKIIDSQLTSPYCVRNRVLTAYLDYKIENNIQESNGFKMLNKLIDEENNVVSLSRQELELIKTLSPEKIKSLQENKI